MHHSNQWITEKGNFEICNHKDHWRTTRIVDNWLDVTVPYSQTILQPLRSLGGTSQTTTDDGKVVQGQKHELNKLFVNFGLFQCYQYVQWLVTEI